MSSGRYSAVVHQIERLFGAGTVAGLTEWQLLHRYVTLRDEVAFSALVARYGPTVLGVCRRLLDDPHDVEDAFQATFLVLVRRAGSLREHDALGSWLYGVANRVAVRARSDSARRLRRERTGVAIEAVSSPGGDPSGFELGPLLDEELGRLPPKYRAPIVLCYLEGRTHEEAAQQLGWPIGSVKGRLARAREVLRGRLARRGLTCSVGALTTALARDATAAVPEVLQASTVRAALALAAGPSSAAGLVSASAALLMEGALKAMFLTKLKTAVMGLTLFGLVATGAGVLAFQATPNPDDKAPTKDLHAEPPVENKTLSEKGRGGIAAKDSKQVSDHPISGSALPSGVPSKDPRSQAVLQKLDEPIAMNFPNETPLEDVLKYIKAATAKGPHDTGIPIYVDPVGLQEAEKTMTSPITMDLEGVPLRRTLNLLLRQLGLVYTVQDGLLIISTREEMAELISEPPVFELTDEAKLSAKAARNLQGGRLLPGRGQLHFGGGGGGGGTGRMSPAAPAPAKPKDRNPQ